MSTIEPIQTLAARTSPLPAWYTPVTQDLLRQITQQIVATFQPEKIILFGSYANGAPDVHSDIDLLVITKRMATHSAAARTRAVSDLFPRRNFGMDLLVRTPREVQARLKLGDDFMRAILEHGSVLYEQPRSRRVGARSQNRLSKRTRSRTATQKSSP